MSKVNKDKELPPTIEEATKLAVGRALSKTPLEKLDKKDKAIGNEKGNKYWYSKPPIIHEFRIPKREGRPTVMTPEVIRKLEESFAMGCSDKEACLYADISGQALYDYYKKDPKFSEHVQALKENPVLMARANVIDAVRRGDVENSKWYLSKKKKDEFGEPEGNPANVTVFQQLKKIIKSEVDETTIDEKTVAFVNNLNLSNGNS